MEHQVLGVACASINGSRDVSELGQFADRVLREFDAVFTGTGVSHRYKAKREYTKYIRDLRTMYSNLIARVEAEGRVRLSGPCVVTGKEYSVVVSLEGVIAYFRLGANVASAFPDLPPAEREFLISGTSPDGWIRLFGPGRQQRQKGDSTPTAVREKVTGRAGS